MVYNISHKTLTGEKPLRIRLEKLIGFIRVYGGIVYLVLFGPEKYNAIYKRILYHRSQKSCITYVITHSYAKIEIDIYNSLPL